MSLTASESVKTASQYDDREIKEIALTHKKWAVELVVEKYRGRLYYHALCIVKDPQEAYDAVQEVFLDMFRANGALSRFDPERAKSFRSFLFGVAYKVALRQEERLAGEVE